MKIFFCNKGVVAEAVREVPARVEARHDAGSAGAERLAARHRVEERVTRVLHRPHADQPTWAAPELAGDVAAVRINPVREADFATDVAQPIRLAD